MLRATNTISPFVDCLPASGEYFLSDVLLEVADTSTVIMKAKLHGPLGAGVWARGWLSNATVGTVAEGVSPQLISGDQAALTIKLTNEQIPDHAYMRIESAPSKTEHVVGAELL
jgi:hypothetical protein